MKHHNELRWDDDLEGPAKWIAKLNHTPIRILAGPGTGKTFALKRRVARLLQEGIQADRILVCTFTRMAAQDLENEIGDLGISDIENLCSGTLHALCFRLLEKDEVFEITGRTPRPLLKFEERFLLEDLNQCDFGGIRARKERLQAFNAAWARLQFDEPGWPIDPVDKVFQKDLEVWLRFHEAILIGELIPESLKYLRENPASFYRDRSEHVLIDEYQDLNRAEQKLLYLLSEKAQLIVIGDEDQSIYSFKFAHPDGITTFNKSHPETTDIELEECRRCPKQVVELANNLISNNQNRISRQLQPRSENPDGEVQILQWHTTIDEVRGIADIIHNRIKRHEVEPGQILVLAPRKQIGYKICDALNTLDVAAHSFFQEEVLDTNAAQQAFTLLTLLANPDDRVALRCWCGFNSSTLLRGEWKRLQNYCSDRRAMPRIILDHLSSENTVDFIPHTNQLVRRYQELQGYLENLDKLRGKALVDALFPENQEWAIALRNLALTINEDEIDAKTLHENLLTRIAQPELPTDVDYVRVMSLHKSKGLTANLVVVVGCIEGLIPATPDPNATPNVLEEQRCLFYVAITRTRQSLILSSSARLPRNQAHRMRARIPNRNRSYVPSHASSFLNELGPSRPAAILGADFLTRELA